MYVCVCVNIVPTKGHILWEFSRVWCAPTTNHSLPSICLIDHQINDHPRGEMKEQGQSTGAARETPHTHKVQLEARVRHGKICEEGKCEKNNSRVGGFTNHHCHKKGHRDPSSMRGLNEKTHHVVTDMRQTTMA